MTITALTARRKISCPTTRRTGRTSLRPRPAGCSRTTWQRGPHSRSTAYQPQLMPSVMPNRSTTPSRVERSVIERPLERVTWTTW